jgi:hypothetical protein
MRGKMLLPFVCLCFDCSMIDGSSPTIGVDLQAFAGDEETRRLAVAGYSGVQ